ncbi:MAG TPA: endolytic transglycosylase MltG [Solirubrobacterales bacterium]
MSDELPGGDPFADPQDPAAREREERRREREEKRRKREAKKQKKEEAAPPPPPQAPAEPPPPPRTPEEEFWDEDPVAEQPPAAERQPEPTPPAPEPAAAPSPAVHDEGDPAMAGAARTERRNGDGHRPPRGGAVLGALRRHPFLIFAVIAALFVAWLLISLFQPFHGDGSGEVPVTIPKGSSVSEVGDLLSEKDVIDNSTLFQIRVTLAGKRSELYAGRFTLAEGMSYGAAIDALSKPPVKKTVTVTVPEGYSRSQAAQLVEEVGVPGSYTKATVKSKYLDPADYGGKKAKDLEGFLFPNTFELKPDAPAADLVELQLKDFKRQIKQVDMSYAKSKNLTVFDVLTIASMIEDEAGVASQRKLVASVIYNRLREGIPLGIDATIRFATGNYTEPLTESELAVDSPYNSRTNAGLPPGPINSPGLDAIEAAAHPKKTGYIFYVTDPGTCGKLTFAKTEAEFEKAVEEYNTARDEAGGNSPDTCGE